MSESSMNSIKKSDTLKYRKVIEKLENEKVVGENECACAPESQGKNLFNSLVEEAQNTKKEIWKLWRYDEIPEYLKDNDFIWTGYRVHLTFKMCIRSILKWHNELWNVWTHFVGGLFFIGFIFYCLFSEGWDRYNHLLKPEEVKEENFHRGIFIIYSISALICMMGSFSFHLFGCMSREIFYFLLKFDYVGIASLTGGSMLIFVYESWFCVPFYRTLYMTICSIIVFTGCTLCFTPKFNAVESRPYRAATFVGMGTSGAIPIAHFVYRVLYHTGDPFHQEMELLVPAFLTSIFYLIGAVLFVLRIPERFAPGRFDYSFYSHTYMHTFVVLASLTHLYGGLKMFDYRTSHSGCAEWNKWFS